jgi:hypothetical protein
MSIPESTETPEQKPVFLTLADGNYVGAIRQALTILPVEILVNECQVLEQVGRPPEVCLKLTILGEKEGMK